MFPRAINFYGYKEIIYMTSMQKSYSKLNVAISVNTLKCSPGGRLNKKDGLTRYGNSHVKDKTS